MLIELKFPLACYFLSLKTFIWELLTFLTRHKTKSILNLFFHKEEIQFKSQNITYIPLFLQSVSLSMELWTIWVCIISVSHKINNKCFLYYLGDIRPFHRLQELIWDNGTNPSGKPSQYVDHVNGLSYGLKPVIFRLMSRHQMALESFHPER